MEFCLKTNHIVYTDEANCSLTINPSRLFLNAKNESDLMTQDDDEMVKSLKQWKKAANIALRYRAR